MSERQRHRMSNNLEEEQRNRKNKENISHQSWKANPLQVLTDTKPVTMVKRSAAVMSLKSIFPIQLQSQHPNHRECVCETVTTVLIIQTFLIYLLFYVGMSAKKSLSFKATDGIIPLKQTTNHSNQFCVSFKKKRVPFVFLMYVKKDFFK